MANNKIFSSKQEKAVASALNWKVVTGSGSRNNYPGDVEGDEWLGECKTHVSKGYKIRFYQEVWEKIKEEANSKFKYPVYFVDDGSQKLSNTWCMCLDIFDNSSKFQCPYSFKSNLIFESKSLEAYLKPYSDTNACIELEFGSDSVIVCKFDTFRELIGE